VLSIIIDFQLFFPKVSSRMKDMSKIVLLRVQGLKPLTVFINATTGLDLNPEVEVLGAWHAKS